MFNSFQFGSGVTSLTKFAVNNIEAAVGIDFVNQQYRLADQPVTFADAFIGSSPDLTYSTSSNSTMVNSAGNIVWAPHNSVPNSEDFRASGPSSPWVHQNSATITENAITAPDDGSNGTQLEFGAANNSQIRNDYGLGSTIHGAFTIKVWVKCATGTTEKVRLRSFSSGNGNQNSDDITVTDQWALVSYSFVKSSGSSMSTYISNATDAVARTIFIWGAHVYRSDLGGMAPVPGAVGDFEYYVPTNGNAEYLPRVGHHVYNGSAWVNEGLLIESEERTNLVTTSTDISGGNFQNNGGVITENAVLAPDGTQTGSTYDTDGAYRILRNLVSVSAGSTYTWSFYAKNIDATDANYRVYDNTQAADIVVPTSYFSQINTSDWTRVYVTFTVPAGCSLASVYLTSGDNGGTVAFWGAQLEEGSTPSSYIPTSGATVTRATQTLDIPPAQFSWPDVEYIGPELVVDNNGNYVGDFNSITDINSWANDGTSVISILPEDQLFIDRNGSTTQAGHRVATIALSGLTIGKTYRVGVNVVELSNNFNIVVFDNSYSILREKADSSSTGIQTLIFEATVTDPIIGLSLNTLNATAKVTDVSVREINQVAMSYAMEGRVTYTDNGQGAAGPTSQEVQFYRQFINSTNYVFSSLATSGGRTGQPTVAHRESGDGRQLASGVNTQYAPGVLTPYSVAARHTATVAQGAANGAAYTADTSGGALPDLSATPIEFGVDYMGTIRQFRQFADDVGDTGLVTATNPSTEPTLSLTFDGTGGSFYNLNWSE